MFQIIFDFKSMLHPSPSIHHHQPLSTIRPQSLASQIPPSQGNRPQEQYDFKLTDFFWLKKLSMQT